MIPSPEMLKAMAATGDPGVLTRLLRETWHGARETNSKKIVGMLRLREMESTLHAFIGGPDNCGNWWSLVRKIHAR